MKFGPVPVGDAVGAIAAHSVRAGSAVVKKGSTIGETDAAALAAAGLQTVVAVRLDAGDILEDEAALALAQASAGEGIRVEHPFTGRSNLFATCAGVLVINRAAVDAINLVDEAITLATLAPWKAVVEGEMIATVKIITYAVAREALDSACNRARETGAVLRVAPYRLDRVGVISTTNAALKPTIVDKTLRVLGERLVPTGARIIAEDRVAHDEQALAESLARQAAGPAEIIIVFGASAVSDRRDVIPAAIVACGGRIEHFGMPVDPGNLLLIGTIAGKPVIGAPGCARSPKENGFDWILHRMLAGLPVSRADIMGLGVGGLLMEIVSRPQPREGGAPLREEP